MNRFQTKKEVPLNKICSGICMLFFVIFLCLMVLGFHSVTHTSIDRQIQALDTAIHRNIMHCYAVEGTYPPDLTYLKEHYGLTYDESSLYVDYVAIGSNIMPDVTIISLSQ